MDLVALRSVRSACAPRSVADGARLDHVAHDGGRRVRVDVGDVGDGEPAGLERELHRPRLAPAVGLGRGDVIGVGGQADAGEVGVDARAPRALA